MLTRTVRGRERLFQGGENRAEAWPCKVTGRAGDVESLREAGGLGPNCGLYGHITGCRASHPSSAMLQLCVLGPVA